MNGIATAETLGSKENDLILSDDDGPSWDPQKLRNRIRWKHGFSQCGICQRKLMYELEKGRTLDEIIALLKERHPGITHIRRYAMNAIRQTTGEGLFDDYIVERILWKVRAPVLADREARKRLEKWWKKAAADGARIVDYERQIHELEAQGHEDALRYLYARRKL